MSDAARAGTARWHSPIRAEHADASHASDLAALLKRRIRGEVRFSAGDRALYATDLSVYRQVPIGVVIPRDVQDVIETVSACREYGIPILPRGCGTSLAGQCCNVAVVIDFSKYMNQILELNPRERYAWVEPGVICDQLRSEAKKHRLTWPANPATHEYCTFGGMIGNNSCGSHSVMGGKTVDNVHELDILTYEGDRFTIGRVESDDELERIIREEGPRSEVYRKLRALRDRYGDEIRRRYPDIPRRVSGYNLDDLLTEKGFDVAKAFVGSEGTCALVLRAKVRLVPNPPKRALLVVGYEQLGDAGDEVPAILASEPMALEGFHESVPRNMKRKEQPLEGVKLLPKGKVWLMVEFGGLSQEEANQRAARARERVEAECDKYLDMRIFGDEESTAQIWKIRESGVGSSRVAHSEAGWPGWEDSAVHPSKEGAYLREIEALLGRYDYAWTVYGHFGQGCFHFRINFDFGTDDGVRKYRGFMEEAADIVVAHGGSVSGEHGDGQARAELLPRMFGDTLVEAFREFKRIWDPRWKMNPGKIVDPYPLDSNLRVGPDHRPLPIATYFRFPSDSGSLDLATQRCFGVGKCRRLEGGTMCPSFMVLREEKHTTRGRAHILFEMLRNEVITDGWRSDDVEDSLNLCLSCKGCKGECPESVDIATYKAEFLAHYYKGRLRPRVAYALGLIPWWSRLGAAAPSAVNVLTQTPGLAWVAKRAAGIATERSLPRLARQTFTHWWKQRGVKNDGKPAILLWPDTFNNHYHPATLHAAVEALEQAGYQVTIPEQSLCCGRPLYEYGMLDRAKRQLRQILDALGPQIRAGIPLVGLEPGCLSVFRDELGNLYPEDDDARRLARQAFTLEEFLLEKAEGYEPPQLAGKAVVHGHCHHKAVMKFDADVRLLQRMGLEIELPDSGCCGMAGAFGYEKGERYEVSIARGEQTLMPAVRAAEDDALIISNGFSCREQIRDLTDRRALHTAEVIQLALHQEQPALNAKRPEQRRQQIQVPDLSGSTSTLTGVAVLGGALLVAGGAVRALRHLSRNGRSVSSAGTEPA